jgi:hypothetical protein
VIALVILRHLAELPLSPEREAVITQITELTALFAPS